MKFSDLSGTETIFASVSAGRTSIRMRKWHPNPRGGVRAVIPGKANY